MRYTTEQYGEVTNCLGEFDTTDTDLVITIALYDVETETAFTLDTAACVQVGTTGIFKWSTANIDAAEVPIVQTEMLYVMTRAGDGRTAKGKIVVGGFTDNSATGLFNGAVTVDLTDLSGNASAGTAYPIGTKAFPSSNITDARLIANREGLREYEIIGVCTLNADHVRWTFNGATGPEPDEINVAGFDIDGSGLERIRVKGAIGGLAAGTLNGSECIIEDVTGFKGTWVTAQLVGTIVQREGATVQVDNALSPGTFGVDYDCNGNGTSTETRMADVAGVWRFSNIDTLTTVGLVLKGASIKLNSTSATDGVLAMFGIHGEPFDLNGANMGLVQDFTIPGATWEQVMSDHITALTTGASLNAKAEPGNAMNINTVGIANILAAALLSGETLDVALSRLDNIDTEVTTNIPADIAAVQTDVDLLKYHGAIWIDVGNGVAGTTVGDNGTIDNPVDSLADAVTLAAATGFREYRIAKTSGGPLTLVSAHDDWRFIGVGGEVTIALANQDVDGSLFDGVELSGAQNGTIHCHDCELDGVTSMLGLYINCGLKNTNTLAAGQSTFEQCYSLEPGTGASTLDLVGAGRSVNLRSFAGGMQFANLSDAGDSITAHFRGGAPNILATCTAGTIDIRGSGKPIVDSSAGSTVITTGYMASILELLDGENIRSRQATANSAISGGRIVPLDAVSHLEVEVRAEGAADFSAPTDTYYIVFNYESGASSTDSPASNTVESSVPAEVAFTTAAWPA